MGYVLLLVHWQLWLFSTVPNFVPTPEPGQRIEHSILRGMNVARRHLNLNSEIE